MAHHVAFGASASRSVFACLVIKWSYGQTILSKVSGVITGLLAHSADGSGLVFGYLGVPGNPLAVFAFAVLPTIIFCVSAFFAISMYHIGVMQQIIKVVAYGSCSAPWAPAVRKVHQP